MKFGSRIFGLLIIPAVALMMLMVAEMRPGYFSNITYLSGLLLLEVVFAAVWHYEKWFFLILMLTFLWAGSDLPLSGVGSAVRWVFLAVGAAVGLVKWAERHEQQHFSAIHVIALLCVLSAAVSGMVSTRTTQSLLKTSSLLLLFLYTSCGARVAIADRQAAFFKGLLTACEVVSFVGGVLYLFLHYEVLGNPNSLGAVMGVVIVPVLFWGVLIAERGHLKHRRIVALCLASYLLYASISRAAILGCAVAVTVMCIASRRQHLLVKLAFLVVFFGATAAVIQSAHFDALVTSFSEDVIYKGKPEEGLFGSRKSPWEDTVEVIKESPWFGSGFGTDMSQNRAVKTGSIFRTMGGVTREHGNSYLALAQYVGMLGMVPFVILLILVLHMIYSVSAWLRKTGNPNHFAVPLAFICLSGLIHAFFEDWLFAVGYYLSVFFWTSAFLLWDLRPKLPKASPVLHASWDRTPAGAAPVPLSANR
jgi:O-antigen ligase